MEKRVAILQSNYIPWKGYFDLINMADVFIFYDHAQFTRNDWRNRNRIQGLNGPQWITIPVETTGKFLQPINETNVKGTHWRKKHWRTIEYSYAKAPHFSTYGRYFKPLYVDDQERLLSQINYRFIKLICELIGIQTPFCWSTDFELVEGKTERIVSLCQQVGATEYLTGPAAKAYLNEELFAQAGISIHYMDYSGYPPYPQQYTPFVHEVSIIDLLFNVGENTPQYMKSFRQPPA